ncbi:MAG: phosphoribosylformylglycinamidine cyclo-ligase [Anaerolineales bacterium]
MIKSAYEAAGVDIEAGNEAVALMNKAVRSTYGPEVLRGIGAFGGLYDADGVKGLEDPVLVASTDGVGTKTIVAGAMNSYETLGWDIVNHCIDDILVQGAEPLFFLDYIATPTLDPQRIATIVEGVAAACRKAGCAILGGETAEMPDVYAPGQMDLVGTIVGLVERGEIIDGSAIAPDDVLVGLPSTGLHTNGFSLVRSIFDTADYEKYEKDLGCTLGEALVEPHRSYLPHVRALREVVEIKGLSHITGGGFVDNIPRILPTGVRAIVDRSAWQVPPLFRRIAEAGDVDHDEMYHVFNMGIGLVVVVAADAVEAALDVMEKEGACVMGRIVEDTSGKQVEMI